MNNKYRSSSLQVFVFKRITAVLIFVLSLYILPFYVGGDQIQYRKVYALLPDLGLVEGFALYFSQLDSLELVHYFLSWLASKFLEKDFFIAFFNAVLAYASMSLFQRWKASIFISLFIVVTNFYFVVLYLSAERLKFGFIFLALSLMCIQQVKSMYGLASLALISHAQVLVVYISILLNAFTQQLVRFHRTSKISKWMFLSIFALLPLMLVREQLVLKFQAYSNNNGLLELSRVLLFLLFALWYSKKKMETISIFIPIIMAVFLVGGDRINIFAYFAFLHYGFQCRGGWNFGVLATSVYFFYATVGFLANVFSHGDGFYR